MFKFAVKKITFSLSIILGVMLLTFLLFNVCAGDPASSLLGKNALPQEVENLRMKLGGNLPVLFGFYLKSEAVRGKTDFEIIPIVNGSYEFKRNFKADEPLWGKLKIRGEFTDWNGESHKFKNFEILTLKVPAPPDKIAVSGNFELKKAEFFYHQTNPFNSQCSKFIGEIITIKTEAPYIELFNFGKSLSTGEPVREMVLRGIWPSLLLMLPVFFGELFFGIALALLSCAFKDTILDKAIVIFSVIGMSISYLVLIIFFQWFLGYYCNAFPVWGYGNFNYLFLPIISGIVYGVGSSVRFYRTIFVNELNKEYLRTAAAKGCAPCIIYSKHLVKNAAIPIIAQCSSTLPFLFTGSLLLESFFGIPGLGSAGIDALNNSDLQLLKGIVIFSAVLFVIMNFLADLAYAMVDPRVKIE